MYKIAVTRQEKRDVMLYWETARKTAEKIRDEYDKSREDAFHQKIMNTLVKKSGRPEFMEPYKKHSPIKFNYNNPSYKHNLSYWFTPSEILCIREK